MKKRHRSILITIFVIFFVLILIAIEYGILVHSNAKRANHTAAILIDQVESIISENEKKNRRWLIL